MQIIKNFQDMQTFANLKKKEGKTIAFVPTMGYLHKGHLSLLKKGRTLADNLVLSIFVNPTQFAPTEDLDSYPSNIKKDIELAQKEKTDIVFFPNKADLYPRNFQTNLSLKKIPQFLCGVSRPSHFAGVSLIVAKLFNIVKPDFAIFGQKDYQQLALIKQMVCDLNFDVKIIGSKIIREKDGLAMSSRNAYLTKNQRKDAILIYKSILKARKMFENGEKNAEIIIKETAKMINTSNELKIDYLKICDYKNLKDIKTIKTKALFVLAVQAGKARLIDNSLLEMKN